MGSAFAFSSEVVRYLTETVTRETPAQRKLREETMRLPQRQMQTSPDQVQFLAMLVKISGAKCIVEIGTFTGYSALAMAAALPKGGTLIACDVSKEWTKIAQRYWKEAGVDDRIDLRIAPAGDTLATLQREGVTIDMAFIDADKTGYDAYYEAVLKMMRPGGIIAFDNMLWGGSVADASVQDADTRALRALNAKIIKDERVDASLVTVADGIMLVRKR